VSADSVSLSAALARQLGLGFRVLSDEDLAIIKSYDLVDPLADAYARPATLLLDKEGVIVRAWMTSDFKVRVAAETILEALATLAR
jgi:peroxiredoxin